MIKSNLKFSIILPTFNRSKTIGKAIQSVINQTYKDWELIVIDDGSTDKTKEILDEFKKKDQRIKYIFQQNKERSEARNNGIVNTKGDYICFIDSDDLFHENHLLFIHESILKHKNQKAIYITGQSVLKNRIIKNLPIEKIDNSSPTFFFTNTIITGRVAIASEILKKFKFNTNYRISEDTDLWVRISSKYPDIIQIKHHTLIYRVHEFNSVNPMKYNAYYERKNTIREIYQNNKKHLDKKIVFKTINNCYFGIYTYYKTNKYYFKAFYSMVKAIVTLPNHRLKEKVYLLVTVLKQTTIN